MLRDEIEARYTDEDGLILDRPNSGIGPDTGNGIKNYSVYLLLLHLRQEIRQSDIDRFLSIIGSCEVRKDGIAIPGLYHRGPRKTEELIAHDDYVALAGVSSILNLRFAQDIYNYGSKHFWSFNNLDPDKWTLSSFQGRHLDLPPYWKLCAGKPVCFMSRFIIKSFMRFSGLDAGPTILRWVMCRALVGKIDRTTTTKWTARMLERYPKGMPSVFSEYHDPKHPFAKYSPLF